MLVNEEEALRLVVSVHRLQRSLRIAASATRLSLSTVSILAALQELGPMRIGALAEQVFCSQPTATTTVAALEAEGWVKREPDPTDGRAIQVAVTEAGLATLWAFAREEAEELAGRIAILPETEQSLVLNAEAVLRKLAEPVVHAR